MGNRSHVPAFLLIIGLSGCDGTAATGTPDAFGHAEREYVEPPSPAFDCTDDCSGHEAGYEWADGQGITHPDECSGNSESFIEGCEAYAEEHGQQEEDPYDSREIGLY